MQSEPNTITEADMLESWDKSVTEQSTLHFWSATASGNDGQTFHGTTGIDLTKLHVYTMHWEAGSLSFYIDETLIYTVTGSTVPKDAADGDCNYCMGMGCETETAPVGMYVTIAQYVASADMAAAGGISGILSKLVAEAGGAVTTAPTTGTASSSGSSGSGASGSATGTPVAATGNQSLVITAAEQTGTTLAMSFTLAEEATLVLAGQVAGGAMTPIGTYWDNCKPGTQTLQPYYQPVPANLVEIQLTAGSTVTKFAVTQAGAAPTAPAGGTTTASTYTLAQLTAAVDAELASGAKAAAIESAVSALFAKYIAANPSA